MMYQWIPTRMAIIKKADNVDFGKNVEQLEFLYLPVGMYIVLIITLEN